MRTRKRLPAPTESRCASRPAQHACRPGWRGAATLRHFAQSIASLRLVLRALFVSALLSLGIAAHEAAMAMEITPAATAMPAMHAMADHMAPAPLRGGPSAPACCVLEQCFIGVVPMPDIAFPPAQRPAPVAAPLLLRSSGIAAPPFRPPTLS